MNFSKEAKDMLSVIQTYRRHIHRYPELSYKEKETTEYIENILKKAGISVTRFDDHYGLIGTLQGAYPGKTILLRADIDALPIHEKNDLPYCSTYDGVMHACGHDCHTSMLLGAAQLLAHHREELSGTVKFLFQSGEESGHGANYYVDKGCLTGVDGAMAMHMMNELPKGTFSIEAGPRMSSCTDFTLTVHGVSSHGSMPHLGKDAIVAASSIIMNLQTLVSRENNPLHPLVITIGTVHAGKQFNIVADTVAMKGTIRTFEPEVFKEAPLRLKALATSVAEALGCTVDMAIDTSEPAAINRDASLLVTARKSVVELFGPSILQSMKQKMASEDFAVIMEKVPSVLCFLGYHDETDGTVYPLHSKEFCVNDDILYKGAALFAQFAYDYLKGDSQNG